MTIHAEIANIVRFHLDIFNEIEALDVEMRRPLDAEARRGKLPWIIAGRSDLAAEELAVWRSLHSGEVSETEAVSAMRELMARYYALARPSTEEG